MNSDVIAKVEERLAEARQKHPGWQGGIDCALSVLKLEMGELEHAIKFEGYARAMDEALDVAAVAMRIAAGDWR